ncbi:hypothetical protein ABEB36_013317 [Hypothenemus hampei]|uniref:F-box domain-containing protein n=1 Tax=Hypothenemus hampei TaxID=57062 RepID=A0ABD1E7L2_HYPHA
MKVLYGFYELQTWTYHVSVPAKQPDIKSNGRNFTETLLTPQVLYDIFARLDLCSLSRCAQVNRRWNSIASDLHFYRDVDLKMYWNKINGKTLEKLKEKLQKVRKLDLAWCNEYLMGGDAFNNSIASILETVKDTLTHLSLNSTRWLTKLTIQRIFNCPNLEELRLRNHDFRLINNFSLSCCGNRTTRLTTLDISMSFIEDEHLIKILETIPNLEHLVMDNCEHLRNLERILTTTGTHNLKLKSWSSPLTFCKKNYSIIYAKFGKLIHLEYLNLSFSEPREPYITNCFESIAMNCQKLKRLELMNWDKVTDEELLPIITQCKQLLHLNLTATNISFVTLAVACENLPDLQDICITLCDDINIEMIEHYTETYPKVNFYQEKLYPPKYR